MTWPDGVHWSQLAMRETTKAGWCACKSFCLYEEHSNYLYFNHRCITSVHIFNIHMDKSFVSAFTSTMNEKVLYDYSAYAQMSMSICKSRKRVLYFNVQLFCYSFGYFSMPLTDLSHCLFCYLSLVM